MTVEERLYKLEGIVEGVMAVLPDRVSALEARMDLLRQEVKAEMASLRQEVRAEIAGLRQGMEEKFNGLRQEVKAEINTAFNKAMLYFTGIAVVLGILTLLR
jgi:hypothetical protein